MTLESIKGGERSAEFDDWVAVTRRLWDAFNRGAYGEVLPFLDPEIEMQDIDGGWTHGHAGATAWTNNLLQVAADPHVELLDFLPVDDSRFLVEVRFTSTGRRSGLTPPPAKLYGLVTMRNGRFRRFELLHDRSEAVQAAGLSE